LTHSCVVSFPTFPKISSTSSKPNGFLSRIGRTLVGMEPLPLH
jgi:hypothetical protein